MEPAKSVRKMQQYFHSLNKSYIRSKIPLVDRRYKLQSLLGEGSVSTVHCARDMVAGEEVALKMPKPGFCMQSILHIFLNEMESLSLIRHSGVPSMKGSGLHSGLPYVAMEIAEGKPLLEWFKKDFRRLHCIAGTLKLFSDICGVVGAIHSKNIVHRDLGPHNIFVGHDFSVKIIDFGYAKIPGIPDYAMQSETLVGTPIIMAPEQTYPRNSVDHRVDIYALGICMYLELAGSLPFDVASSANPDFYIEQVIMQQRSASFAPLRKKAPYVPADVAGIVDQAIMKDPEQRFQSASEMKEAIDHAYQNI
ncbi:serine/threonine protein kinase [Candidatus Micrarchaeota archaeon]|nr:serine/threonine protein kinase [Candidatus Micrarchaeota archaeon]